MGAEQHACMHSFIYAFINQAPGAAVSDGSHVATWLMETRRGRTSDSQARTAPSAALSADTSECGGLMEIGQADRFNHKGVLWHQKI